MSEIILPPGITLPKHIQPLDIPDESADDETKATALPVPTGYKMLCVVPNVDEKIAGTSLDLVRDAATMRAEEHATTVLFVLRVGPDAYKDSAKFPTGAWCRKATLCLSVPILVRASKFSVRSSASSTMTWWNVLCKTLAV